MATKNTPETNETVETAKRERGKQVSAVIPEDAYKVLSDYRFDARKDRFTDVIREAVMDKVEKIRASQS